MSLSAIKENLSQNFSRDFTASIVVFLVAMPLCMGIAIASGVPAEKGLLTGIIGGIVVGLFAGSPLQVSGPAAGLAVIVFDFVTQNGLSALGPMLVLAGALQLVAGWFKLGAFFRSISPAVVHGMLAGIGALIVISQFHILFDAQPLSSGIDNLAAMPARLLGLTPFDLRATELALLIGLLTIAVMLVWEKYRPSGFGLLPGALLGVMAATIAAWMLQLDIARVDVPESIIGAVRSPDESFLSMMMSPAIIIAAIAVAFIASAETLLSAAAVDRMHDGVRTNYDKELSAQGVGNFLCGLVGALPMTGVIVRSSANVQAGARSRTSTILHGFWILGFVSLLPWLLREIPMAALGGVLVVTGWRLVSLTHVRHLYASYGALPAVIWTATFVLVVAVDLLTGVLVGLALTLIELVPHMRSLRLKVEEDDEGEERSVHLEGSATFVSLTGLTRKLEEIPMSRPVRLHLDRVRGFDHTSSEQVREWIARRKKLGNRVEVVGPGHLVDRLA
ncbi:MFS superfamily sulfate permease-like transporter [Altererythrobacter atlanticus]|uniref:Bicarbonate transporter BicA n=1 Tax=Croceibacterium atlanticum TaxID=1267766 RepID=A0A0F7KWS9_9SPHN|nr:SulP family inorganic anion transporter [Croceibacterium atlanticum]AKH44124.1 Bicarbonate transporter BicA [Croceibacterium atlanticum]MBB5732434.1 MFS superfamily sulfate permease-like transporter [Croceibacterium atlanticum]